jgi:alcohol dehydrogenase, propanol-preferring
VIDGSGQRHSTERGPGARSYRGAVRAQRLSRPAPIEERPLEQVDLRDPEAGPGELVVALTACAVCRTDLQVVEGDLPARRLPIVPGHQAVGRVELVGPGVNGWKVGERAGVAWLASACGVCEWCLTERENLCPEARFMGWDRDGGFATHVVVRADFALRVPDGFADLEAAPLLCGGVIGYRSLRVSGIQPGGRLGLFGFGASAQLAMQVARSWGCEVHVRTRSRHGQDEAAALGAASVGPADELTPPLDAAVTFAPTGDAVVAALGNLRPGGTLAINAIHLDRIPSFSYDLLWSERGIRSVANYTRADANEFLALAVSVPVRTAVQTFPLRDANAALSDLAAGQLGGTAVLVTD